MTLVNYINSDLDFVEGVTINEPHFVPEEDLNDLVRDLGLPQSEAEILASFRMAPNIVLSVNVKRNWSIFFSKQEDLTFCNNVVSLMESLGVEHKTEDWCLFIDSSKTSLNRVLLHNGIYSCSIRSRYEGKLHEHASLAI